MEEEKVFLYDKNLAILNNAVNYSNNNKFIAITMVSSIIFLFFIVVLSTFIESVFASVVVNALLLIIDVILLFAFVFIFVFKWWRTTQFTRSAFFKKDNSLYFICLKENYGDEKEGLATWGVDTKIKMFKLILNHAIDFINNPNSNWEWKKSPTGIISLDDISVPDLNELQKYFDDEYIPEGNLEEDFAEDWIKKDLIMYGKFPASAEITRLDNLSIVDSNNSFMMISYLNYDRKKVQLNVPNAFYGLFDEIKNNSNSYTKYDDTFPPKRCKF